METYHVPSWDQFLSYDARSPSTQNLHQRKISINAMAPSKQVKPRGYKMSNEMLLYFRNIYGFKDLILKYPKKIIIMYVYSKRVRINTTAQFS